MNEIFVLKNIIAFLSKIKKEMTKRHRISIRRHFFAGSSRCMEADYEYSGRTGKT